MIGIFQVRGILAPFKRWRVIWLYDMIRLDYVMLYLLPYYITLFYSVLYYITILHYILNIYIYIDVSCKFPQIKPWYEHAPAHPSPLKMLQRASGRTEGCHGLLVWMAQPSPEKQKNRVLADTTELVTRRSISETCGRWVWRVVYMYICIYSYIMM